MRGGAGESGFTLTEALLVLALLAVLAGLAIPAVAASSASARLERAAAEYAGALREARANAIAESVPWSVTVPETGQNAYALARLDSGRWQTERTAELQGVTVAGTDPAGVSRVTFYPSGGPEPACQVVLTAGARSRTITVAPATGRVSISR